MSARASRWHRGLPRAFGALRSRLGRASESLVASCFNERLHQFKIDNSKFKITPAFLRPSLRVSSPFGLSEGPCFNNASRQPPAQPKTQNSELTKGAALKLPRIKSGGGRSRGPAYETPPAAVGKASPSVGLRVYGCGQRSEDVQLRWAAAVRSRPGLAPLP